MRRVLLLIILCVVLVGCAPAAAQTPTWSEEEAAYWLAVNDLMPFPILAYTAPEVGTPSDEATAMAVAVSPPAMGVLRELYNAAYTDCTTQWRLEYCVDARRAVRLELARIVEEKGSYPAGYVQEE